MNQSQAQYQDTGQPITALYERLSRDDEQANESLSITNQKSHLAEYAARNGFTNCRHYTDDGYSGGNFERPGWKHLVEHVHERRKLAADRIARIHAVANGDKADALLTEIDFGVKTRLDVIATHAAEILGDDDANLARVNVHDELFPSGTVEAAAAVAIVRVVPTVRETIPGSVFGQVAFLIGDGQ